jgi:uncharacterized repeat protein (TIGR01451 family)
MNKLYTACFVVISLFLFLSSPALADDEVRNLSLDLKAKGFTQTDWKDNLDSSNIIFAPNDKFQLQLTIRNLGNRNQTQIKVHQTLPTGVSTDSDTNFTISQIAANEDYVKNITVTIKDKKYISNLLTKNTIYISAKSDVGTEANDTAYFYTSGGGTTTVSPTTSNSNNLPGTGTASTLIFGSIFSGALGFTALKLRKLARGY